MSTSHDTAPGTAGTTGSTGVAPVSTSATVDDVREAVRARYAAAATTASCCGSVPADLDRDADGTVVFGGELYAGTDGADEAALAASLGCGVPTAVADLVPGEVVLDLGSGAGGDVLISARRVGPTGRAIGLDMTPEMLDLARSTAAAAGVVNVDFVHGYLEDVPLADGTVDVVLSNCVLNLAADKDVVLAEAARVLRPGGRLAFSDVVADDDMDEATRADMAAWTGCVAGALTTDEMTRALARAGFVDLEVRPTHRVHAHARAAVVRATLPATATATATAPAGRPSTEHGSPVSGPTDQGTPVPVPHVLFVCVRNGGKSQMAAGLLRRAVATHPGAAVTVSSAGTDPGRSLNAQSVQVLAEVDVDLGGEHPRRLTDEMVAAADLVVVLGAEAHVDPVDGTPVEVWHTDEPSTRGIDGLDRMRLVRDDIATRVDDLHHRLTR